MTYHDKATCWFLFNPPIAFRGIKSLCLSRIMTSETENLKLKLQSLISAFSDLEDQLSPIFAQSLPETLVHLEPIQQAKLQTALAYVVYDLIFSGYFLAVSRRINLTYSTVYLKTKGIDPETHPVVSELVGSLFYPCQTHLTLKQDRIKQYFDKIQNAENPPSKQDLHFLPVV